MVFSSKIFIFAFLPIVLGLYVIVPKKLRNYLLLGSSLFFYAFGEPKFVVLMISSIVVNYVLAIGVDRLKTHLFYKRIVLAAAVILNLGLLVVFKYLDFIIASLNGLFSTELELYNIALPIGISFFTFQALSYVVDVYRGDVEVQSNPLKLGMYISLFPQLIAGPIVRYADIAKDIDNRVLVSSAVAKGLRRFIIGLSKKVLLADIMALTADRIFALQPNELTPIVAWIGIISYTLQIYLDFSGYSDMAIGLGSIFGFSFLENFNYPYFAKSISEFWRKWHISLSTWFRDYLYIPLGGNRHGNTYVNLLVVFIATGLWHGANFKFVVWGLWHGAFLIFERALRINKAETKGVLSLVQRLYTILIVIVGWVFFRADSLTHAFTYIRVMFGFTLDGFKPYNALFFLDRRVITVTAISVIISIGIWPRVKQRFAEKANIDKPLQVCSYFGATLLFVLCILFIMNQGYSPFIYFRF